MNKIHHHDCRSSSLGLLLRLSLFVLLLAYFDFSFCLSECFFRRVYVCWKIEYVCECCFVLNFLFTLHFFRKRFAWFDFPSHSTLFLVTFDFASLHLFKFLTRYFRFSSFTCKRRMNANFSVCFLLLFVVLGTFFTSRFFCIIPSLLFWLWGHSNCKAL